MIQFNVGEIIAQRYKIIKLFPLNNSKQYTLLCNDLHNDDLKVLKLENFNSAELDSIQNLYLEKYEKFFPIKSRLIAQITDQGVDKEKNIVFLAYEYIKGIPLAKFIKMKHNDPAEYVPIIYQLFLSIKYLHSNFIVHTQLNPDNFIINDSPVDKEFITLFRNNIAKASSNHIVLVNLNNAIKYTIRDDLIDNQNQLVIANKNLEAFYAKKLIDIKNLLKIIAEIILKVDLFNTKLDVIQILSSSISKLKGIEKDIIHFLKSSLINIDSNNYISPTDLIETFENILVKYSIKVKQNISLSYHAIKYYGQSAAMKKMSNFIDNEITGIAIIKGKAGIGKSLFISQMKNKLQLDGKVVYLEKCKRNDSAMGPFMRIIEDINGVPVMGDNEKFISKTQDSLVNYTNSESGHLLSNMSTLNYILSFFLKKAIFQDIIVFIDDFNNADKATIDILYFMAKNLPRYKARVEKLIFAVAVNETNDKIPLRYSTTGTEFKFNESIMHTINLTPLDKYEVTQMVKDMLGYAEIPKELITHIINLSKGIPLYIEELIQYWYNKKAIYNKNGRIFIDLQKIRNETPDKILTLFLSELISERKSAAQILGLLLYTNNELSMKHIAYVLDIDEQSTKRDINFLRDKSLINLKYYNEIPYYYPSDNATETFDVGLFIQELNMDESILKKTAEAIKIIPYDPPLKLIYYYLNMFKAKMNLDNAQINDFLDQPINPDIENINLYIDLLKYIKNSSASDFNGSIFLRLGQAYALNSQPDKSIMVFKELFSKYKNRLSDSMIIEAVSCFSRQLFYTQDYKTALDYIQKAVDIINPQTDKYIKEYLNINSIFIKAKRLLNMHNDAYNICLELKDFISTLPHNTVKELSALVFEIYMELSELSLIKFGEKESIKCLELLIDLNLSNAEQGKVNFILSSMYSNQYMYNKAIEYAKKASILFANDNMKDKIEFCNINLGRYYHQIGQYMEAMKYFNKSLIYSKYINDIYQVALLYNLIGITLFDLGYYYKGRDYLMKAYNLVPDKEQRKNWDFYNLDYDMGYLELYLGNYNVALDIFNRRKSITAKTDERLAYCYDAIGKLYKAHLLNDIGDSAQAILTLNNINTSSPHYNTYLEAFYEYDKARIMFYEFMLNKKVDKKDILKSINRSIALYDEMRIQKEFLESCILKYMINSALNIKDSKFLNQIIDDLEKTDSGSVQLSYMLARLHSAFLFGNLDNLDENEIKELCGKSLALALSQQNKFAMAQCYYFSYLLLGDDSSIEFAKTIISQLISGLSQKYKKTFQEKNYIINALLNIKESENPLPNLLKDSRQQSEKIAVVNYDLPVNLNDSLDYIEKTYIEKALSKTAGNASQAAKMLGLSRQNLHYLMKKYKLK